jgi:hypothetical protein
MMISGRDVAGCPTPSSPDALTVYFQSVAASLGADYPYRKQPQRKRPML